MQSPCYMTPFLAFFLLALSIVSLWIQRKPAIWGTLLALSLAVCLFAKVLSFWGIIWFALLAYFWISYREKRSAMWFALIAILSLALKMHFLPGFYAVTITPKFWIGVAGTLIGFFPLALIVPLSQNIKEWLSSLQGAIAGVGGIAVMAGLAVLTHTVALDCKMPAMMALRTVNNLFFVSIPEEAFYRGFLQNSLCRFFGNRTWGNLTALFITSAIFAAAHVFWSPDLSVLIFVFIASLLYGGVYLWSGRIESAIATHFLLNLIHQSCFTYHAM